PARLLKALVAGGMTGGYRERWPEALDALQWIERQPPPEIVAPRASPTTPYRLYVPNNDSHAIAATEKQPEAFNTATDVRPKSIASGLIYYLWRCHDNDLPPTDAVRNLAHCLHTLGWGIDMAFADVDLLDDTQAAALQGERYLPSNERGGRRLDVP